MRPSKIDSFSPDQEPKNSLHHDPCLLRCALGTISELQTEVLNNSILSATNMLTVGIAMLQGARHEHMHSVLKAAENLEIPIEIRELRKAVDIEGIDAIILPGGESTAMKIASRSEDLFKGLWELIRNSETPVLGTCAGAILLAQQELITTPIVRNAFGRQKESFQSKIRINFDGEDEFMGVFIRAPRFTDGSNYPIAWYQDEVVGVQEGNIMALTFHPELTEDYRFHEWLLNKAKEN